MSWIGGIKFIVIFEFRVVEHNWQFQASAWVSEEGKMNLNRTIEEVATSSMCGALTH